MLNKALYPSLRALKDSFRTTIASIYCFAAKPRVQAWINFFGSL
jgi:hypothetical protein